MIRDEVIDDVNDVLGGQSAWAVVEGDSRHVLPLFDENSIDAIVTDPPYALTQVSRKGSPRQESDSPYGRHRLGVKGFMGQQWDNGEVAHDPRFWLEALRVAKPGARLLAFGGTRTAHRLACAIEDAGWTLCESIYWAYGEGFPKNRNLGDGRGTALKPAVEPIVHAMKPFQGTYAQTLERWGTGALNIDACRISAQDDLVRPSIPRLDNTVYGLGPGAGVQEEPAGRWPANFVLSHTEECADDSCVPGCPVRDLDQQSGVTRARRGERRFGAPGDGWGMIASGAEYNDVGGASRFFYCAKPDKTERHALWGDVPARRSDYRRGDPEENSIRTRLHGSRERANFHPTVKPVDLMRYLCRLVTPPGGVVLDCFAGSGTTGVACLREDLRCIMIDGDSSYVQIARARLTHAYGPLFATMEENA